ncbi:hypothetical protein MTYP_01037 [Methylophilaceae bacterium]|nr:hypothetical protein MTYP_01037 [Methylophilaceae bacterium]
MPMYKVVKTFLGAPEGHTTFEYKQGEEFKERGPLLKTALEEGWVEEVEDAAEAEAKAAAEAEAKAAAGKKAGK